MDFHNKTVQQTLIQLSSNKKTGLTNAQIEKSVNKHGKNILNKAKTKNFFARLFDAFKEPMLVILLFGFVLAFGTEIGKFLKTGEGDFAECVGILFAIILSVSITLIMEGSSQRAFNALGRIYDNLSVRVIRNGKTMIISQVEVVVGDIIILESGDKIVADGRLVESNGLLVDESALTGESLPVNKDYSVVFQENTPLAERKNCVYSGTFITSGSGIMVVTAIGNSTEIGGIAGELCVDSESSPLQVKLAKLGKIITLIGASSAITVFLISIIRLYTFGSLDFSNIQSLFVSCIILIVAAVPEGLPTIVAVSLALNMIKLAKENALIKKMTATETAGAVSVICSDKTGTLTENKMKVMSVCKNKYCTAPNKITEEILLQNFVCNSTADLIKGKNGYAVVGSATEGALLQSFAKSRPEISYEKYREEFKVVEREPFSSEKKYMTTTIEINGKLRKLIKGAPERVLIRCALTEGQKKSILDEISAHQKKARRIICFAHKDIQDGLDGEFIYDGFVAVCDPVRKEVLKAVLDCKRAGIKVKILTGDNAETAFAVARELNLAEKPAEVINAQDIEKLDDQKFKQILG
ncbi:MAG: cation-transporting P-type ATPase, partial [Clostridia bacterium]|nr:cation-transporting P-type ATPase [Clostridia bacterium]